MKALEILRGAGFGKVRSLAGGVDAWASRIETGMARY
jgi:rhodanese-related sulfurtransferase